MKNLLIITIFILSISMGIIAFGFESDYRDIKKTIPPNEISISADAGNNFGMVTVKIKTNKNNEDLKISNIELFINNEKKSIPNLNFLTLRNLY